MIRIDAEQKKFIIDLRYRPARKLADMVIETIMLHAETDLEDEKILLKISRSLRGEEEIFDCDLTDHHEPIEEEKSRV